MNHALFETLFAREPHPSLGEHAQTYQRVIGSWRGELHSPLFGTAHRASVEAHFAWVLEGRAVQDVWITPARDARGAHESAALQWYGSTLRVFDPTRAVWRTVWTDPGRQLRIELLGTRHGDDIVQVGLRDGRPIRWTFSSITRDAFTWQGHALNADGHNFDLEIDIQFKRIV
jgi:hypothetical protein